MQSNSVSQCFITMCMHEQEESLPKTNVPHPSHSMQVLCLPIYVVASGQDSSGFKRFKGGPGLKGTQTYTTEFGEALVRVYLHGASEAKAWAASLLSIARGVDLEAPLADTQELKKAFIMQGRRHSTLLRCMDKHVFTMEH